MGAGAGGFNWLPVLLAERRGLLARRGLTISRKRLGAVDKATAAVKSGELELAITPPEGAITDRAAGGELRIIAANLNRLPLSLVANPRFRRIEERLSRGRHRRNRLQGFLRPQPHTVQILAGW